MGGFTTRQDKLTRTLAHTHQTVTQLHTVVFTLTPLLTLPPDPTAPPPAHLHSGSACILHANSIAVVGPDLVVQGSGLTIQGTLWVHQA